MNRSELSQYILETYPAEADHPWLKYPENEVLRHSSNKKWFALITEVEKRRLGLNEAGTLTVVNLKCDPLLLGSLRQEPGFFPAYHMSKTSWITAALDGSVPDEKLKMLVELSYQATAPKPRRSKGTKA